MKAKMKSLLFVTVLLISFNLSAQNTTQEEYNFMSRGFKTMMDDGLDMKKGYYLKDTVSFSTSGSKYQTTFVNMMRQKDKSYAGTICLIKRVESTKLYYLAIPAADSKGHIDLEQTLMVTISNNAWDSAIKTAFLQSLAEYMGIMFTKQAVAKVK